VPTGNLKVKNTKLVKGKSGRIYKGGEIISLSDCPAEKVLFCDKIYRYEEKKEIATIKGIEEADNGSKLSS
jgi:hypothetical protein